MIYSPIIIKLGGSIITEKKSALPLLRTDVVRRLARELRVGLSGRPLILLHGAGSFGHPLVHKYQLSGKPLSGQSRTEAKEIIDSVRKLNVQLCDILMNENLPVVSLQTSSFVQEENGNLAFSNFDTLERLLRVGQIPVFGGDVVVADEARYAIASADRLAVRLAMHFGSERILFATDVDGVYDNFPPEEGERPREKITRWELENMSGTHVQKKGETDVTGAMGGKLQSLLPLHNCEVIIFNGEKPDKLSQLLSEKKVGTTIRL